LIVEKPYRPKTFKKYKDFNHYAGSKGPKETSAHKRGIIKSDRPHKRKGPHITNLRNKTNQFLSIDLTSHNIDFETLDIYIKDESAYV